MRYLGLKIGVCIAGLVIASGASAICYATGLYPWGIFFTLAGAVCIISLVSCIRRPVTAMESFAEAMLTDDSTLRLPEEGPYRSMSRALNEIMGQRRATAMALETRKLYYDRILSVMTHEMRNSITPVIALAADIHDHPDRYARQATLDEAVGVILAQSSGIKRFLDAYHSLTHLPAPQVSTVDARAFISEIKTAFDSTGGNIKYTVAVGIKLKIDPDLMRRALDNLIRNALEAGTEVMVTVSQTRGLPYIAVSDNGPGISPRVLPNLFQPFISDKPGGTGIGLTLARQIARLHGGDLRAATSPHGTTFTLTLGQ